MSADTLPTYPVRVEGHLDPGLSRWLWLVKWLLVIPHYVVLCFLWVAFAVLSVVAFFAILFTGRYPRGIFEFNVGVLRWSWRVAFYAFAANGTDRYPPFSLRETEYPATLEVEFPARLSRGLVLVKSWLLAIPHYLVLALFLGGGAWAVERSDGAVFSAGLISILTCIAVVVLLFTGRYPREIFDFVLGMNRWVIRVAAYAGLMTDRYPPFRLDMGEDEPGTVTVKPPPAPAGTAEPAAQRRTSGRHVVYVVAGSLVALIAAVLLAAGGTGLVYDQTQRDPQGFLMTDREFFSTGSYALVSEKVSTNLDGPDWISTGLLDEIKIRSDSARAVFVGIGPAAAVERYLAGVPRDELRDLGDTTQTPLGGTRTPAPPEEQSFWVTSASGPGEQSVQWHIRDGSWRAVVMATGGERGVDTELSIGATVPDLGWISAGLLGAGALLLLAGGGLIFVGARGLERTAR